MGAIEFFRQKPIYLVLLAALAVFTLWVCVKAGKASSARRKENEAMMQKLKEYAELRREFEPLTEEKAKSAEAERLFKGVALGLCRRIEKSDDMEAEFAAFSEKQKMLYALWYVFEDGEKALSGFFKMNGSPLTDNALLAVKNIYGGEAEKAFAAEFSAYDENDESASLIPDEIKKLDESFAKLCSGSDMFAPAARFIIENLEDFQ